MPPSVQQPPTVFIRATRTHSSGGKPAFSFRLVHSQRVGSSVQQKTLLNLGARYDVPKPLWPAVTSLAQDLLRGQAPLLAADPAVLAAAENLVRQLRARGFASPASDSLDPLATVRLDSLAHEHSRSAGAERLCLHALDELGFAPLLQQAGVSSRDARIASALVLARMLHPSSEREAQRWLEQASATLELLGLDHGSGVSLAKLYRTNDLLWKHRELLQEGLFARERELLELPATVVFYDLTNCHYTGRENKTLRRFGRSKQKRSDCPLVTLALALDGAGFPRRCEVLAGNVSEPGTLQDALTRLAGPQAGEGDRPTVVLDAGIASEANLTWLREQGWDWIAVSREARPEPPQGDPAAVVRTRGGYDVRAWPLASDPCGEAAGDAGGADREQQGPRELRVYAVSEARRLTAEAILAGKREKYEQDLTNLHKGLSIQGRLKNLEKVQRKLGRLAERYSKVAGHYEVQVSPGEAGKAAAVTFTRKPSHALADETAGAYVLRTSHADWDAERVLRAYWELTEVESTFRSLKSDLGLRPVFHRLDRRVSAHLFVAVLAYHGVHLIRTRLQAHGLHLSWKSIRDRLQNWVRLTTTLQEQGGKLLAIRQDVRPEPEAWQIARAAGLTPRIHRRQMQYAK